MKTVIIDLDGTLANVDHRLHLIRREKPDWDAFYAACDKDTPNIWCMVFIHSFMSFGQPFEIVTARRSSEKTKTADWMRDYFGFVPPITWLRHGEDYRPDDEIKEEWLKKFGPENILFVIDDRQRVVDMWRRNGVTCLQCAQWDEYKKEGFQG